MIKQTDLPATLLPRAADSTQCASETLTNLRPRRGGAFVPVGTPAVLKGLEGCRPLCRLGDELVLTFGTGLILADDRLPGIPATMSQASLPAPALCVSGDDGNTATVMTAEGPVRLSRGTKDLVAEPADSEYPPLTLYAEEAGAMTANVADRLLSGVYAGAATLESRDASALVADLESAYLELCARSAASGVMIQPALARYRLRDESGNELFVSPPVLLQHTGGTQLGGLQPLYSSDRQRVNGYTVTAYTWLPVLGIPEDKDPTGRVATAELWMTPLFHPYYPGARGETSLSRLSTASAPFGHVGLPGREYGLSGTRARTLLYKAIARMDALEERVAVIPSPFNGKERRFLIDNVSPDDAATSARTMASALRKPVRSAPLLDVLLSPPHTFTAGCCAADASTTAWANLTVHRYRGYPAACFGTNPGKGSWTATTVVTFGGGKGVVRSERHSSFLPTQLSAVLSYPSPDATSMTIIITGEGTGYSCTVPLTPDESWRMSVFVSDGARPIELERGSTASAVTVEPCEENFADAVAMSPTRRPLVPDKVVRLGGGAIRAIVARAGTDQSWEFGRCRFVAGGDGGVYSVGVGRERASVSARRLWAGSISSPSALCCGESGEIFALTPEGSDDNGIVCIGATGRATLFEEGRHYVALGYNRGRGELWALRTDTTADIFCRNHGWRRYSRTDCPLTDILTTSNEPYGISADGTPVRLCRESSPKAVEIELTLNFEPHSLKPVYMRGIQLFATGSGQALTLTVEATDTGGKPVRPVFSGTIRGDVRSPLSVALFDRPLRRGRISLCGSVGADFVFTRFTLMHTYDR